MYLCRQLYSLWIPYVGQVRIWYRSAPLLRTVYVHPTRLRLSLSLSLDARPCTFPSFRLWKSTTFPRDGKLSSSAPFPLPGFIAEQRKAL